MASLWKKIHAPPSLALPLASLVLLVSCVPALAQADPGPPSPNPDEEEGTLQVTGQSQILVPADRVRISLTVETEGSSAADATAENARRMEAVMAEIRSLGISGLEIETFGYSLRPEYEVSREGTGTRAISGYRVQNNIRVTLPDVEATGRVMDRGIGAGANRIADLQFEASDTREARLEALREAVANAQEQAAAIASAMGVRLGIALEVQGGASAPSPRTPGGMMLRAAAESTTPVEAGDQRVSASVTITYRIQEVGL